MFCMISDVIDEDSVPLPLDLVARYNSVGTNLTLDIIKPIMHVLYPGSGFIVTCHLLFVILYSSICVIIIIDVFKHLHTQ